MDWKALLASITGSVDQALLLRNEYLVTENRILRHQITGRVRLSNGERKTLAEMGKKLGKQALAEVASIVTPDTILAWHRKLVAHKFDGSPQRKTLGRPKIDAELEALVVRMAQENRSRGYDRDGKYCLAFQRLIDKAGITRVLLPPRSPNLNAYDERRVRSVKEECLLRLILFGKRALQHALTEYVGPFHRERPYQGMGNVLLMPAPSQAGAVSGPLQCRERPGGLLKYYDREAA